MEPDCLTPAGDHKKTNETSIGSGELSVDGSDIVDRDYSLQSKHKVFLSHSGAQKDFVEQLCVDLERWDRYPFFDRCRSSLPIGEKFPELIFGAIHQCQVGVVVLSEEFFTKTKWPMLELDAMLKELEKPNSRIRIIPVFYLISRKDWLDPKNHARWILQWEEWAREDKRINVEEWKSALNTLKPINSMMKEGMGDVKFREEICAEVCKLVNPETRWNDSHLQGRSCICKVIRDKMDKVTPSFGVCVVGLYGTGGIGKTTICKALCNELATEFHDQVCHAELGSCSEMELLRKTLKKLTSISHVILDKLDNVEECHGYLKNSMLKQQVFLALDNMQDDYKSREQVRMYLKANYNHGSILLITTRSLDILENLNLDKNNCLEMPELEEEEARSLFLNNIDLPLTNDVDEGLIMRCIKRCQFVKGDGINKHYHPLALKVLGQQLGCNSTRWAAQLGKIDTFNQLGDMEHPVFSIFRNTFDSLQLEHQLVFMDVALFSPKFVGGALEHCNILEWLCMVHEESVEDMKDMLVILKRKSLLEDLGGGFTKIGMHDLWHEFAILETKLAKDSKDPRHWIYEVEGKKTLRRSGWCWKNVERMCFIEMGWRGLNGLKLDAFENTAALKLEVASSMGEGALDLDLSGLKQVKSLDLNSHKLAVRMVGLSSLKNLAFLRLIFDENSGCLEPCFKEIGGLTNLQILELKGFRNGGVS